MSHTCPLFSIRTARLKSRMPVQTQPREQGNLPVTRACEIETGVLYYEEERSSYSQLKCEVVKVQATNRDATLDIFHEVTFPIDHLDESLMIKATQLVNLRCIAFNEPLSWEKFMANHTRITERALGILTQPVPSLRTIIFCVDILNDEIFRALNSQSGLKEVELLPSAVSFPNGKRVAQIAQVLNRGIPQLSKVEFFKMPLELATPRVLSRLGQLACLSVLEITGTEGSGPERRLELIRCIQSLPLQTLEFFGNLRVIRIKHKMPKEGLFFKYLLEKFPNIKFIQV